MTSKLIMKLGASEYCIYMILSCYDKEEEEDFCVVVIVGDDDDDDDDDWILGQSNLPSEAKRAHAARRFDDWQMFSNGRLNAIENILTLERRSNYCDVTRNWYFGKVVAY